VAPDDAMLSSLADLEAQQAEEENGIAGPSVATVPQVQSMILDNRSMPPNVAVMTMDLGHVFAFDEDQRAQRRDT
jgi:hypothetical protein